MNWNVSRFFVYLKNHLLTRHVPVSVPPEILKLRDERGNLSHTDCVSTSYLFMTVSYSYYPLAAINYSEFESQPSGMVQLMGRVK